MYNKLYIISYIYVLLICSSCADQNISNDQKAELSVILLGRRRKTLRRTTKGKGKNLDINNRNITLKYFIIQINIKV